jgi:hypothetical protein
MRMGTVRLTILTGTAAAVIAQGAIGTPLTAAKAGVTFTKDVAPILQRSCQNCHRPDAIGPMSLLTYEDVRPWATAIKARVSQREMPPWFIDRNVGIQSFKNDVSLSDDQIDTIVSWVSSGAPKGDMKDMPPPARFEDDDAWLIGKPDLIVKAPVHKVPAAGADWWGEIDVPTGLTEDRYIKAIQTRAGNRLVVHHAITNSVDEPGAAPDSGQYLSEYAVGKRGDIYPEGTGKLLKAGSLIRFEFHYHSIGKEATDETQLGLILYPKGYVPKRVLNVKALGRVGGGTQGEVDVLDIPGGQIVRHDGYTRLNKAAVITGFQPHMHLLGKRQCLEFIYPNGSTEMANCANWNFNWHVVYNYNDDAAPIVPAGTIIHVISYHDNTTGNRGANDPKNWAGSGHRTIDEMAFAHISWYDLTDEEYKQMIAARRGKTTSNEK